MLTYYASGLMDMVISVIAIINSRRGGGAAVVVTVTVVLFNCLFQPGFNTDSRGTSEDGESRGNFLARAWDWFWEVLWLNFCLWGNLIGPVRLKN